MSNNGNISNNDLFPSDEDKSSLTGPPLHDASPIIFKLNKKIHYDLFKDLCETFNNDKLEESELMWILQELFSKYRHRVIDILKSYNFKLRTLKHANQRVEFVKVFKGIHQRKFLTDKDLTELLKDACSRTYEFEHTISQIVDNPIDLLLDAGAILTKEMIKNLKNRWGRKAFQDKTINEEVFNHIVRNVSKETYSEFVSDTNNLKFLHYLLSINKKITFTTEDFYKFYLAQYSKTVDQDKSYTTYFIESLKIIEERGGTPYENIPYPDLKLFMKLDFSQGIFNGFQKVLKVNPSLNSHTHAKAQKEFEVKFYINTIFNGKQWKFIIAVVSKDLSRPDKDFTFEFPIICKFSFKKLENSLEAMLKTMENAVSEIAETSQSIESQEIVDYLKENLKAEQKKQTILDLL